MKNNPQEIEQTKVMDVVPVLAGMLIGGLAGAGAMLLLAPQSGKETRAQIQYKTIELRDRASESVDQAMAQVKSKTHQFSADVRVKAEELQQHGQELLVKQLDHVSAAAEAGKVAVQGS